ncbi:MAG: oligosaccharide flippase family protein, partial [Ignavibacteria bacterium]|nr:oligosaccharide flippase family protein [Ignavibacteria bacterium]
MNSKSHISELFRQTVIYGLGIMLNKSVGFLLIPLYTKYFPPEQIGLFTLVQSLSLFLGVVYMFGMETSFMKFFIDEKGEKDKAEVYSSTLIFLFIVAAALSSFIYIYSGSIAELFKFSPVDESSFLVQILSLMMLIDTLYRFPLLLFRAKLESKTYALINLFTFFINIISNVVFIVILKYGVESIFYSYILSSGIT